MLGTPQSCEEMPSMITSAVCNNTLQQSKHQSSLITDNLAVNIPRLMDVQMSNPDIQPTKPEKELISPFKVESTAVHVSGTLNPKELPQERPVMPILPGEKANIIQLPISQV